MRDFLEAAARRGLECPHELDPHPKPGMVYAIARGHERIEVEISNGGIPHKVRRTLPDGTVNVLGSAYFRMADVLSWMERLGEEKSQEQLDRERLERNPHTQEKLAAARERGKQK